MRQKLFGNQKVLVSALLLGVGFFFPQPAAAITPEDPRVMKSVQSALKFLENARDERLGGNCLIALCFKKAKIDDHPKIAQAVDLCHKINIKDENLVDNYSLGIALMFLCEIEPKQYHDTIVTYVEEVLRRQKPFGGWGYPSSPRGDTSQTQYAILGCGWRRTWRKSRSPSTAWKLPAAGSCERKIHREPGVTKDWIPARSTA